jgi:hypothetical protein
MLLSQSCRGVDATNMFGAFAWTLKLSDWLIHMAFKKFI